MTRPLLRAVAACVAAVILMAQSPAPSTTAADVLKATLPNGMRVVIVRNTLAPVVSTDMTYLVGSRDDPAGVPGMAHAQEHMMFRGTRDISTAQLGTIATALGGDFNAQTTDTLTQYQFTVPAADLDAVLRIESDRMRGVLDLQSEWQNERGAIEQEVLRDASQPAADFFRDAEVLAYKGTPYGHEGVGTVAAFDRLTGPELHAFWQRWYAPNNAVLVIAGDVDPQQTLAAVRARFAAIPSRPVPAHAPAHLAPLPRTVIDRATRLAYPLAAVGFRMPGLDDPDFIASFVLQGILGSDRGPLQQLVDRGDALNAGWSSEPYTPAAQLGFAVAALPPGADPARVAGELERIVEGYARTGVPSELFATVKQQLIEGQEESRNSIPSLASDWATTIALDGQPSIAREQQLIGAVTLADVDRVAKKAFVAQHAIIGALTPSARAGRTAPPAPSQPSTEKPLAMHAVAANLPPWAHDLIDRVDVPSAPPAPTSTTLPNGIRLIVQPETISKAVVLYGRVKTEPALQQPPAQRGVADVLDALFGQGTSTSDRESFQRTLDRGDVEERGGTSFALEAPSNRFAHAVDLLADNELHPRFAPDAFAIAKREAIQTFETAQNSAATAIQQRAVRLLFPPGDPELDRPTAASLNAVTLRDVEAYHAAVMRPDLATIVVVGDVTPADARAAVEHAFGAWRAAPPKPELRLPPLPLNPPGEVKMTLPIGQDIVDLEQIVDVGRTSPDLYPLLLGNAILGGGSLSPAQSRLFRDLRQEAGLVYTIASQLSPRRSRYDFSIQFACAPQNQGRITQAVEAEVRRLQTQPVDPFELALMKASMVRKGIVDGASVSAIGGALLDAATHDLPFDQHVTDDRHLLAVDAQAVRHAFATYIKPDHFVRIVEGP